jgi:hypothetical protein
MFARAFQKVRLCHVNVEFWLSYQTQTQWCWPRFPQIESLFGLSTDGFMTSREMKQCHDEFYLHGGDTQAKTSVSIDRIGKFSLLLVVNTLKCSISHLCCWML